MNASTTISAAQGTSLGDTLDEVLKMLGQCATAIKAKHDSARKPSGLEDLIKGISSLKDNVQDTLDDIVCVNAECRDYNNDGEGENGYCGNCADARYGKENES